VLKEKITQGRLKLLVGTDAASTGLNLQRLSCLINLDLPWNPTVLEQRKGRVQRGTIAKRIPFYNLRYDKGVEQRAMLSRHSAKHAETPFAHSL